MARFLSEDWLADAESGDGTAAPGPRRSEAVALVLQHVVTDAPEGIVCYHVVVASGTATLRAGQAAEPDLTFTSDYPTAAAVARGELSTHAALSLGRIRVRGNIGRLAERQDEMAGLDAVPAAVRAATTYLTAMASGGGHRAAGWYTDPEDATRLRHWNGRSWSSRRRARPGWTTDGVEFVATPPPGPGDGGPVLEGPARSAALPATAAATVGAGERPALGPVELAGLVGSPVTRRPHPPGRVPHRRIVLPRGAAWPRARAGLVVSLLVAAATLTIAVSVGLARPPAVGNAGRLDALWVNRVNAACRASTGKATAASITAAGGPAAGTSDGRTVAPTVAAGGGDPTVVASDAQRVEALATTLAAVQPVPPAGSPVDGWLASLRTYATARLRDAAALEQGSTAGAAAAVTAAGSAAAAADQFAASNGLAACLLDPNATASPVVPIP